MLVTLAKVAYIHEADLICMELRKAGIETFIADENLVSIYPLYSGAIGGIRIRINSDDFKEAKELLSKINDINETSEVIVCPKCSSNKIEYKMAQAHKVLSMLAMTNSVWSRKKLECVCNNCGYKWIYKPN